jgi:hypothetical protein
MFGFLRSLQIFFQSGCTSLQFHQQCTRVPFSPHPHQHMLLMVFLMIAILIRVRWNLNVVLICISFMARDGEHFFMCFLTIWVSSFEKVLFSSVAHFYISLWIWGSLIFCCIFWLSVLCLMYSWQMLSPTLGGLFSLETISFVVQKLFNFM